MWEIIMNQYESENADRIISEIKEIEKSKQMSIPKKAFYVYQKLGDIYQYKVNFRYQEKYNFNEKIQIYQEGTTEQGEAICTDMNRTYVEILQKLGIESHLAFMDTRNPLSHTDACFKDEEENWYFANLTSDVMRIKTRMKIRNFGLSQKQLYHRLYSRNPDENREFHLYRMNEENYGKLFTGISQEQLKQWSDEFGYTHQGLYTDEVLEMLAREMLDERFIASFFGTNKKDELVQKKIQFIMDRVEIINVHRRKEIGDIEALEYYEKIANKIFSQEESKYLSKYEGFIEEDGSKKARHIVVIKKEEENIYYLYNSESQIFEKIDKEVLLKQPIKHYTKENEEEDISETINRLEKRLEEVER